MTDSFFDDLERGVDDGGVHDSGDFEYGGRADFGWVEADVEAEPTTTPEPQAECDVTEGSVEHDEFAEPNGPPATVVVGTPDRSIVVRAARSGEFVDVTFSRAVRQLDPVVVGRTVADLSALAYMKAMVALREELIAGGARDDVLSEAKFPTEAQYGLALSAWMDRQVHF